MIWQGCYLPLQRSSIYTHTQTQTATAGFHSFKLSHTGALCHCNADKHSVSHAGWTFTSQASVPQQCQIQLTEINKIAFSPAFALPGTNILVHSFFLSLSFTSSSPDQPRSASLLICFFASFFLSSFRSPAGPPACGEAVVDQTHSPAGGDIPFISSLFQMALLCISWQPVQPMLFAGENSN